LSNSYRGLRFKVSAKDIENGQPNDPCACAAARALKRHFDAKEVFVYRNVTYILRKDGNALRYHTSPALRLETIVFDRNGEFFPGEYDLEPAPLTREVSPKTKSVGGSSRRNASGQRRAIPNVRPTASTKLPTV
jgi:hypothetical protein